MNAGDTMRASTTLVVEVCCTCQMLFAIPADLQRRRMEDHGYFCCPAGHRQSYAGPSEAERLRRRLIQVEESQRDQRHRMERAQRQAAAARGQVTRIKRRVAKGICPCCSKTFADLGAHMEGQHPEWSGGATP